MYKELIDAAVELVRDHSKKRLMKENRVSKELLVLMEADLLDETGALSLIWDCLAEGVDQDQSYVKADEHMLKYTAKTISSNPMITEQGKSFWEAKRKIVRDFLEHLRIDLGL